MTSHLIIDVGRVLYVGALGAMDVHKASASALLIGMDGPFDLTLDGATQSHKVARVAARTAHALDFDGARGAVLFFDPGSTPCDEVVDHAKLVGAVAAALVMGDIDAWNALLHAASLNARPTQIEPRLAAVVRRLTANLEAPWSASDLAASAELSVSRLEHLFTAHYGVPMRAFRTWHRFRLAAKQLLNGCSITDAAHAAGFHDAAHFSNAFRDTFGMPPSHAFTAGLQGRCLD